MKRLLLKQIVKFIQPNFLSPWKVVLSLLLFLILPGFQANAQELPLVTVRFNNPTYDCPTQTYCVDVEFTCDTEGQQLFGMNVRFIYDDNILEYLSMGDFQPGYVQGSANTVTYPAGSGANFGLAGPLEWFNGTVRLIEESPIFIGTNGEWTKLFNVCFHVDDPYSLNLENFCPSIIWDLEEYPDPESGGGYFQGDDGVTITVVDLTGEQDSSPTIEDVVQFNWMYFANGNSFGHPVATNCVSTECGEKIPVSNWSLFLAIGLMVVATLFIYRRRISS
jgi:hypothetical protein